MIWIYVLNIRRVNGSVFPIFKKYIIIIENNKIYTDFKSIFLKSLIKKQSNKMQINNKKNAVLSEDI